MIAREEIVVVLFIDESTPLLNVALKKAGRELELTFGLVVIDVTDIQGIQVWFFFQNIIFFSKA